MLRSAASAHLLQQPIGQATAATAEATTGAKGVQGSAAAPGDPRLQQVREHLRRYRELAAQGKWSEAGRELEAVESLVRQ